MFLQIAWRNIWRNPRRTGVILTAVVIGVWSMIFMSALMRGMELGMVKNGLETMTGNIQIHHPLYRQDPVLEHSIPDMERVEQALAQELPAGAFWSKRIRVSAVASNARHSGGVTLVAIEPEEEKRVSFIGRAVREGRYLTGDDSGIVVGEALLEKYETSLGKRLILMAPRADGEIKSRSFRIVGVYDAEMEATEKQFAFISMKAGRKFLGEGISEVAVGLPGQDISGVEEKEIAMRLQEKLPGCKVSPWTELLPMLAAYVEISDGFLYIWFLVVFVAMGFGIVNTSLMAVYERIREFGLLAALGMKPWQIIRSVLVESSLVLLLGIAVGSAVGMATIFPLSRGGINLTELAAGTEMASMPRIIYPLLVYQDMFIANLFILVLGILVSLYPAFKAARFRPVEALTHV